MEVVSVIQTFQDILIDMEGRINFKSTDGTSCSINYAY